jgi:hypothetical protein
MSMSMGRWHRIESNRLVVSSHRSISRESANLRVKSIQNHVCCPEVSLTIRAWGEKYNGGRRPFGFDPATCPVSSVTPSPQPCQHAHPIRVWQVTISRGGRAEWVGAFKATSICLGQHDQDTITYTVSLPYKGRQSAVRYLHPPNASRVLSPRCLLIAPVPTRRTTSWLLCLFPRDH